ncbi:MAG: hypothetical protein QGG23_02240 [Candidatus Bathyarchaeota archaeon]|jgi:hypothetical protein|nr:hypothetical protein [Candidatus Bathyarchaeota archaeon]
MVKLSILTLYALLRSILNGKIPGTINRAPLVEHQSWERRILGIDASEGQDIEKRARSCIPFFNKVQGPRIWLYIYEDGYLIISGD